MPRLFHRPPKYRRHKTSAIVSLFGKRIHLGPYGSQKSHERYQELLKEWEETRHASAQRRKESGSTDAKTVAASVTEEHLRQKYKSGVPVVMNELILVYRRHTHEYYRKHGEVTREAGAIDDALRILRKHHGMTVVSDFGPVSLNKLREAMIDELDWSRKYINKQVNRIRAMFK